MKTSFIRVTGSCALALVCAGSPATPAEARGQLQFYEPVWISASWTGGATGPAIDRKDRTPETPPEWKRQLCPPAKVKLAKSTSSLSIVNSCPGPMTFYMCATKGSAQPPDELEACAQDPFDTPMSRFRIEMLDPGPDGNFFNVTMNLSIQVFYCSEDSVLVGPPVVPGDPTTRSRIACLGGG